MKEFKNEDRDGYYGVRVGDQVEEHFNNMVTIKGTVVSYVYGDNNAVYVKDKKGNKQKCVAEWLTVTKKVEDK